MRLLEKEENEGPNASPFVHLLKLTVNRYSAGYAGAPPTQRGFWSFGSTRRRPTLAARNRTFVGVTSPQLRSKPLNQRYGLIYKRGSQEKYFSLDRK